MNPTKYLVIVSFMLLFVACGNPAATPTRAPTQSNPTRGTVNTSAPAPTNVPTEKPTSAPTLTPTRVPPTNTLAPTQIPPTTAPTNTRAATSNSNSFTLDIEPIVTDLSEPIFATHAGDGTNRLFIVEQGGQILIFENGRLRAEPFLDLSDKITTDGNEQGLLGLAFHPDYKNNGQFFVHYSRARDGDTIVARYQVSNDPNVADASSEKIILHVTQPEANHNGGMLAFGPDGYLYIGMGDGGGAGDRHGTMGNGQALNTLLGKILRMDVNVETYRVPDDNPFVNSAAALPEIWSYGLRNPWRFSFDRATGDLYIGDVGQGSKEEIDFQPASSKGGENYGWRIMEGDECFDESLNCNRSDLTAPIAVYSHDLGCSVTGGYVYRGQKFAWLQGQYIFADYCTGIVWATARRTNGEWQTRRVTTFDDTISSFGEDEAGEMYVAGHKSGTIYKLTSQPK